MTKSKISVESIVLVGIFTALVSIISALPIGFELFGVPATLQTFAMSFIGYLLCYKLGTGVTCIYILLGLVGIPVFNKFMAGPSVFFGPTGGFIFGFLALSFCCGFGLKLSKKAESNACKALIAILAGIAGLLICHFAGIVQFSIVYHSSVAKSFLLVSLPYLPKDIVSVIIAYFIALSVRAALSKAKLLPESAKL